MSEKPGYIPLYRKIQDNFLWKERRVFSKAEAWIDILMEARFSDEPETFVIGTKLLQCSYGEVLYSMDTWADRWRWSKSKVKRVLDLFAKCSMIELKNETVTTRISVLNYSKYDPRRNGNETQVKRKRNASETHVEPTEEGKEGKKVNKPHAPFDDILVLFGNKLPMLSVPVLDEALRAQIRVRWNEHPDIEWWIKYFDIVLQSPWLIGNGSDWKATLPWLMGPKNMSKVLNGQYLKTVKTESKSISQSDWF